MVANGHALWHRLMAYFRPPPIVTGEALRVFLEERAAFIAQKCAIDYCRGKTGLASYALFTEKPFLDALDVCRRETFAAVLGDLILLAEGHLRPHVAADLHPRLAAALIRIHDAALAALPTLLNRPQGWDDVLESFAERMRSATLARPRQVLELADRSAKRLFETLPIHISMRELDEEVVYGAVRFRMIAINQDMTRRLRAAEVAASLLA